ncbi:unnamed protein product [Toxocara canis]|uniref:Uncharacterized protein n=1 Tax=Toxocara canis TaxID=6265 RepID=A0A183V3K4_TOXCA|nr:unnamed protein product [Toxocara canis]
MKESVESLFALIKLKGPKELSQSESMTRSPKRSGEVDYCQGDRTAFSFLEGLCACDDDLNRVVGFEERQREKRES